MKLKAETVDLTEEDHCIEPTLILAGHVEVTLRCRQEDWEAQQFDGIAGVGQTPNKHDQIMEPPVLCKR